MFALVGAVAILVVVLLFACRPTYCGCLLRLVFVELMLLFAYLFVCHYVLNLFVHVVVVLCLPSCRGYLVACLLVCLVFGCWSVVLSIC